MTWDDIDTVVCFVFCVCFVARLVREILES